MMTRETAELWVVGIEPAPQGSKRYVGGNAASGGRFIEASKKLEPFRKAVGQAVIDLMNDTGNLTPFTEPVIVRATFYMPRPKTVKRAWPSVTPDLDKLQRSLGDSLSLPKYCDGNPLLQDDSLIVQWEAQKVYAEDWQIGVYVQVELAKSPWPLEPLDTPENIF